MSLRRSLALVAVLTVGLVVMLGTQIASGSHYRANQLNWHQTTGNTVEFHFTGSWRCTFFFVPCSPSVGDTFSVGGLEPGDGSFLDLQITVTAVDLANDVVSGESHVTHTYSGPGPWTASHVSCCRLSSSDGHMNNGDGSVRFETVVDLGQTSESPVSLIAPIVDCPIDALCSFTVPAVDPDGQGLNWRFATDLEASGAPGGFAQPPGATINATTGLYQWNTTGAPLAPSGDTFYSTQIVVENVAGGVVVTKTPVDFFIRLGTGSSNAQPVFVAPTPADGSVIDGTVGSEMTFSVAATDPDAGDTVTLGMLGQPAGSSYATTPGNPATGAFSWTPAAPGDYLITLTAADQAGLGAVPRGIILRIASAPPPTGSSVSGDGKFGTGSGLTYFELSNESVSLVKPRGEKFTFDGDVDSIVGSGNGATMTGTGTYNGVAGHTFSISVVDMGSPGARAGDSIDVVIRDPAGAIVFSSGGPQGLKGGDIVVTEAVD